MGSYLKLRVVNGGKTEKPILRLKQAVQKLQRRLFLSMYRREFQNSDKCNRNDKVDHDNMGAVPKGHFPVVTIGDGDEPRKFLVSLSYLTNPAFVELLEEMERKFGFGQKGVLVVPCKASELQRIMSLKQAASFDWNLLLPPHIPNIISISWAQQRLMYEFSVAK